MNNLCNHISFAYLNCNGQEAIFLSYFKLSIYDLGLSHKAAKTHLTLVRCFYPGHSLCQNWWSHEPVFSARLLCPSMTLASGRHLLFSSQATSYTSHVHFYWSFNRGKVPVLSAPITWAVVLLDPMIPLYFQVLCTKVSSLK